MHVRKRVKCVLLKNDEEWNFHSTIPGPANATIVSPFGCIKLCFYCFLKLRIVKNMCDGILRKIHAQLLGGKADENGVVV